jgi:cellulose biosynthesis protein BcsQ
VCRHYFFPVKKGICYPLRSKTTIIPIASGKGGVGKSFLTANLGVVLAEMGHTTVVVDMDLGGSSLHFFLGLSNRFPGIGDFLKARRSPGFNGNPELDVSPRRRIESVYG